MRTGERPRRGFTYLWLLFALVLGGVVLAAVGQAWQTRAQREREAELLWRGLQIRDALQRYAGEGGAWPRALSDLLEDHRHAKPRHWLRRLYADPFTGQADWLLLRDATGGVFGVASRSRQPALRLHGLPEGVEPPDSTSPSVGDWKFVAGLPARETTKTTGRTP